MLSSAEGVSLVILTRVKALGAFFLPSELTSVFSLHTDDILLGTVRAKAILGLDLHSCLQPVSQKTHIHQK